MGWVLWFSSGWLVACLLATYLICGGIRIADAKARRTAEQEKRDEAA